MLGVGVVGVPWGICTPNLNGYVQDQGSQSRTVRGPHSIEKMLRGPQFKGEKVYAGHKPVEKL